MPGSLGPEKLSAVLLDTVRLATPTLLAFQFLGSNDRRAVRARSRETCSNCLPRTLGSGLRRAKRSPNVVTAGTLIEGYHDEGCFSRSLRRCASCANCL